jgi:monomeric isocitrate dehydrogenase
MSELEIVWTKVDEAPALATFSLLDRKSVV